MMSATFGGLTRDVLCGRPPRILHSHSEIYASTALLGSTTYMTLRFAGLPVALRICGGVAATAGLRWMAYTQGIRLPTWDGSSIIKG
jgi:uncharacterized membrane protein YeiH